MTNAQHYEISAAIDFGTTYSGIAYSYEYDKEKIYTISQWPDGSVMNKVPTAILFDPNLKLIAFGQEAIDKYSELADNEEEKTYYYFYRFKMVLYKEQHIHKDLYLEDATEKKMKAITIFSAAIGYLKNHLISSINERYNNITSGNIHWVLTVPAIWNDSSKQFMREAAVMAGISSRDLLIALEPEAASLYCLTAPKERMVSTGSINNTGVKYLVLDNGGGTVDITAHRVISNGELQEVYKATGGAWGGTKVDEAFADYLTTLFSKNSLLEVQKCHPSYWVQLMQDFEVAKKKINSKNQELSLISLSAPSGIWNMNYFNNLSSDVRKGALVKASRLKIPKDVIKEMILNVSKKIKQHTSSLLKREEIKDIDFIMMVGGFSNSSVVVNDIKDLVDTHIHVIVPEEAELAVLKGAVLFSWKPNTIKLRKSKKTYGFHIVSNYFIEGIHPHRHITYYNDVKCCDNIFDTLVLVNQDIELNKTITRTYMNAVKSSLSMMLSLYVSDKNDAKYIDDNGVVKIGTFTVPMPNTTGDREVDVEVFFGETEIRVNGRNKTTGESVEGTYNFLTL